MKLYEDIQNKLKNINLSYKEFAQTNLFNFLQNNSNYRLDNYSLIFAHITSMCLETNPEQIRIRNDSFLKQAQNEKDVILISSYKDQNNEIIHFILSSYWFFDYSKKVDCSNSFINFNFSDLNIYSEFLGLQYKKNNKKVKYIFLTLNDNNEFSQLFEYVSMSKNINESFSKNKFSNIYHSKNDPAIPYLYKKYLYELSNYSCFVHKFNKTKCRMKIDWENTKKSLKGTNLNVPIDFHHFIPRSLFKKQWLNEGEELNWKFIHSKINLIPLCQICHQSIHNSDKKLSKETFENIINSLKNENLYEQFLTYLKSTNFLNNIDDLLNFYINEGEINEN